MGFELEEKVDAVDEQQNDTGTTGDDEGLLVCYGSIGEGGVERRLESFVSV